MPEEAMAPETESQDTPTPDAASVEETPAEQQPTTDWEQRYNSLRPEYDRNNQLLAAARGDHGYEAQMLALQQLGVDVQQEEPEEEDPFEDPTDRIAREVEELKQWKAEQAEAAEMAEFQKLEREYIDTTLGDIEKRENVKLSAKDKRFVENDALVNRLPDGKPDLEGAIALLKEIKGEAKEEYLTSKKADKAPVGAVGEEQIDLRDERKRNEWMTKEYARLSSPE